MAQIGALSCRLPHSYGAVNKVYINSEKRIVLDSGKETSFVTSLLDNAEMQRLFSLKTLGTAMQACVLNVRRWEA